MRLTTKGRFAVTAMIDLARNQANGPVSLSSINQRQDISIAYLEQLFSKLRRKQLVKSIRGPGGGYKLSKPAKKVSIADIVFAVDEPMEVTRCGGDSNCAKGNVTCVTHNLWAKLNEKIIDYLNSVTLDQLSTVMENKPIILNQKNIILTINKNEHSNNSDSMLPHKGNSR